MDGNSVNSSKSQSQDLGHDDLARQAASTLLKAEDSMIGAPQYTSSRNTHVPTAQCVAYGATVCATIWATVCATVCATAWATAWAARSSNSINRRGACVSVARGCQPLPL